MPKYVRKQGLKDALQARELATEANRKDKKAKKLTLEKAQIAALIEKHRCHAPDQPDQVIKKGKGKNSYSEEQEGKKKVHPQIKRHCMEAR